MAKSVLEQPPATLGASVNGNHYQPEPINFDDRPILPEGFGWGDDGGLYELGAMEWVKGRPVQNPAVFIARPFVLTEVQEGSGGRTYVFQNKLKDSWQPFTIPAETIEGMGGFAKLSSHGVNVHNRPACLNYIRKAVDMLNDQKDPNKMMERNGWLEGRSFVCGDRIYRDGNNFKAAVSQIMRDRADELRPTGDLATWQSATNLMLGQGSYPQAFAVLCGFAAPLMLFEAQDEGGCIVSLQCEDSGTGKTTAAQCAASIWGKWHLLNMTNDDSHNARMIKLGMMNHLPVIYDEMVATDAEALRKFINTYCEGKERERSNVVGNLQRTPYTWCNLLLTTGNRSLVEVVSLISKQALGMRILELTCDRPLKAPSQGKDYFKQVFSQNYGWAGHRFLSYITHPQVYPRMRSMLQEERIKLETRFKFPQPLRFYERTLTCCAVAAKMVEHMGLISSINFGNVLEWVCFTLMKQGFVTEVTETYARDPDRLAADALAVLTRFLAEHARNLLIVDKEPETKEEKCFVSQHPWGELVGRVEEKEQVLYVTQPAFKAWAVKQGVNIRETLSKLKAARIFEGTRVMDMTAGTIYPAMKVTALAFGLTSSRILPPRSPDQSQAQASPPRA